MTDAQAEEEPRGPAAGARICTPTDVAAQYRRHHESLAKVAARFFEGKRPDAAENAVMDVMLRLTESAKAGELTDKGEDWGPYLRRAVRNSCVDIVRREKREREHFPQGDPELERIVDLDPLGDAIAQQHSTRWQVARLKSALATLDESELLIIWLTFWKGATDKQIGDRIGTSGQAVGQRKKTILRKLLKEVTKDE
ncbi:sigma-70 family RNA polymerase sigma factor [Cellulomonas soli]|uniref:sigma-70 family RNA polymerase sigma factor n=1 Tax=Cellulomonas soli TaxID=931535 RepID=UPI0015CBEF2C|nr:sigma-70 family RNA polymerase sigma factor [Cellulomonas soli]NYI58249.1 RNA polymerase sigma factor (sigma-70 family) [Cellulomonas soli]